MWDGEKNSKRKKNMPTLDKKFQKGPSQTSIQMGF